MGLAAGEAKERRTLMRSALVLRRMPVSMLSV